MLRHSLRLEFRAVLSFLTLFAVASAQNYVLQHDYQPSNFLSLFTFDPSRDLTNGHVQYVNETTALQNGYFRELSNSVRIGVDHTGLYPRGGRGRPSIRMVGKMNYTRGLFIADIAHMPGGCGLWPAFWMNGPNWPNNGEIDIIEGANQENRNNMVLHSSRNCTISGGAMTGALQRRDCAYYPNYNAGCSVKSNNLASFGQGFNANGGGIYATEWTSNWIRVWFFPRDEIPATITNGDLNPNITAFGLPTAHFQGGAECNITEKFNHHHFLININFCGEWAGNGYAATTCPKTSGASGWDSCVDFVGNNPTNFTDAYWEFNYIKAYEQSTPIETVSIPPASSLPGVAESSVGPPPLGGPESSIISTSEIFVPASSSVLLSTSTKFSTTSSPVVLPTSSPQGQISSSSIPRSALSSSAVAVISSVVSNPPSSSSVTLHGTDAPVCPTSNQTIYTFDNRQWLVECGISHGSCDLQGTGLNAATLQVCIERCAARTGCVYANWYSGKCYEKSCLGTKSYSAMAQGGVLIIGDIVSSVRPASTSSRGTIAASSSVPLASSSTIVNIETSTSAGDVVISPSSAVLPEQPTSVAASSVPSIPSAVPLVCPGANQTSYTTVNGTYRIDCGIDYAGIDIPGYGLQEASFQACVNVCVNLSSCLVVTYANGRCYPKTTIRSISYNVNQNSAVLIGRISSPGSSIVQASSTVAGLQSSSVPISSRSSSASQAVLPGSSSILPLSVSSIRVATSSDGAVVQSSSVVAPSLVGASSSIIRQPSIISPSAGVIVLSSSIIAPTLIGASSMVMSSSIIQLSPTRSTLTLAPEVSSSNIQTALSSASARSSSVVPPVLTVSSRLTLTIESWNSATSGNTAIVSSSALDTSSSPTPSDARSASSSGAFSTSTVDLSNAYPDPRITIQRDVRLNTTFAEFAPDSSTPSVSLTIPVNGTPTNFLQKLVFLLVNDGYYFGKLKRLIERQLPRGCFLNVFYGGQQVFTIDIADLFAEYTEFSSDEILPNTTDTAITFNQTCRDTTTFPTLRIANISIQYQGNLAASSGVSLSKLLGASSGSSLAPGASASSFSIPLPAFLTSSEPLSASFGASSNTFLGTLTSLAVSGTSSPVPGSTASIASTRRTITITHSTCAPRSVRTVFTTATVTECPATCPVSSSSRPLSTSSAPSGTCISTLSGSLCYECGLLPTVITTTCADVTTTTTSSATRTSSGPPGSISTPSCPYEPSGRLFVGPLGRVYALYCGLLYEDPDVSLGDTGPGLKKRQGGSSLSEGRLKVASMLDCIMACDNYNIIHPKSNTPCRGVSYYPLPIDRSPNCYLKASVNSPRPLPGVDSARLITLDPPPGNDTITVTTTVFSGIPSTIYTGGGTGPGGAVTITQGTGPGGPGIITVTQGTGPGGGNGGSGVVTVTQGTGGNGGPGVVTITQGTGAGTGGGNGGSGVLTVTQGTGPGNGGSGLITITQGTGPGNGPGTGPGPTSYVLSVATSVSTTTLTQTTTVTSVSTFLSTQTYSFVSTSVSVSTIRGSSTTIFQSITVPVTIVSTSVSTQPTTIVQTSVQTSVQVTSLPVTITRDGPTITLGSGGGGGGVITITQSGGGGGVVTVTNTIGGGTTRDPFLCYSASQYYLNRKRALPTPARRILGSQFSDEIRRNMQPMRNM